MFTISYIIGTGTSAIYTLLCAKRSNWKMIGTDINPNSIHFAQKNIEKNGLGNLIKCESSEIFIHLLTRPRLWLDSRGLGRYQPTAYIFYLQ
jgi:23S rRNA A1618 N6-methylase RlmF